MPCFHRLASQSEVRYDSAKQIPQHVLGFKREQLYELRKEREKGEREVWVDRELECLYTRRTDHRVVSTRIFEREHGEKKGRETQHFEQRRRHAWHAKSGSLLRILPASCSSRHYQHHHYVGKWWMGNWNKMFWEGKKATICPLLRLWYNTFDIISTWYVTMVIFAEKPVQIWGYAKANTNPRNHKTVFNELFSITLAMKYDQSYNCGVQ